MSAYYNENEPFAAAWLRNLIAAGLIASGDVDERSIEDVKPGDLRGYRQCHFFAGIGGWSYALRLAGWPDDKPVWTGSCPCQPFSSAGQRTGFEDERHLWPAWFHLIQQCQPAIVFGEQVASRAAEPWIDLVQSDLEAMGYALGCVPFPAAGVGAPHIRDRNYWVADAGGQRLEGRAIRALGDELSSTERSGGSRRLVYPESEQMGLPRCSWLGREADWIACRDGKWRPVEPGTFPLAHGIPSRMGRLRGYGNAIVPEQAAHFILASQEARSMTTTDEARGL